MEQKSETNIKLLEGKKILQYPSWLGSSDKDAYGHDQQYVVFKINTDEKTTKLRSDKVLGNVVVANTRTGVGVEGAQIIFKKNDDPDMRKKFGDTAVEKEKWFTQKGMQRLDRVIVLPMPNEHSVRTSVQYNSEYEPTLLTKLGDFANQGIAENATDLWKYGKNAAISGILNSVKKGITNKNALFAEERLALNPKKEVMFESMGFRKFSMSYTFAPKDERESEMVRAIIETFRYYSLPEIANGKMFYLFPSEFEISFMNGQIENTHIPRITSSVLQSINVNYMPSSLWSSLPNGAPLSLSISMEFLELELVDRLRIFNPKSAITSGY